MLLYTVTNKATGETQTVSRCVLDRMIHKPCTHTAINCLKPGQHFENNFFVVACQDDKPELKAV